MASAAKSFLEKGFVVGEGGVMFNKALIVQVHVLLQSVKNCINHQPRFLLHMQVLF